jgi:hypothetical protein
MIKKLIQAWKERKLAKQNYQDYMAYLHSEYPWMYNQRCQSNPGCQPYDHNAFRW